MTFSTAARRIIRDHQNSEIFRDLSRPIDLPRLTNAHACTQRKSVNSKRSRRHQHPRSRGVDDPGGIERCPVNWKIAGDEDIARPGGQPRSRQMANLAPVLGKIDP